MKSFITFPNFRFLLCQLTVHSQCSVSNQCGNFILENALVLAKVFLAQLSDGNVSVLKDSPIFGQFTIAQLLDVGGE